VCCSGGTQVTVYGDHLNSVAEPRITVTTVVTSVDSLPFTVVVDSDVSNCCILRELVMLALSYLSIGIRV